MGNDGGSIPGRKDLVKEKPKEIKVDETILAKARAQLCAMTKERLKPPVAMCRLGFLYNKESILKALLEKAVPAEFGHIKKLKDIKTVKFAENPEKNSVFPLVCPLSKIEYNGLNVFYALWSCGCVFAEKAFKEVKNKEQCCISCGEKYQPDDLINLNMSPAEQAIARLKLLSENKEKKKDKNGLQHGAPDLSKIEEKPKKKMKDNKEEETKAQHSNILDQISQSNGDDKNNVFKSLFHKDHKVEGNLFHRNVRHGIR